jgi:flagellar hook-basal body complex protein FliE
MKTGFRMAFGLPLAAAIERVMQSAQELSASADKMETSQANDFGQLLKETVSRMTAHRRPTQSNAQEEEETFGAKLKRAVRARARGRRVTRPA